MCIDDVGICTKKVNIYLPTANLPSKRERRLCLHLKTSHVM